MSSGDRYVVSVLFDSQVSAASFAARANRKILPEDVELRADRPEVLVDLGDREDLVEEVRKMATHEEYGLVRFDVL